MRPEHARRRLRTIARADSWAVLSPFAKLAIIGLILSAVLSLGLAWFIPHRVEIRFLQSMASADEELVTVLVSDASRFSLDDPDEQALDATIGRLIEENRLVRTKLWSMDGTILYSDDKSLVGRTFEPDEDFSAIEESVWHLSDLSADENTRERGLGYSRLLETYVPLREAGRSIAVWEVYRSLEEFDEAISSVRRTVWFAVGFGLTSVAIFLVGGFGALLSAIERKRHEAERRGSELETLLDLARIPSGMDDPTGIANAMLDVVAQDARVRCACLFEHLDTGGKRLIASAGDTYRCAALARSPDQDPTGPPPGPVSEAISGRYVLQICQPGDAEPLGSMVLGTMIEEIAAGVERARLTQELEANRAHIEFLLKKLVDAQEEERRSTVAQIHDGLAQDLHRVLFGIRGCLRADEDESRAELMRLEALVSDSSKQLRRLLQEIHPSVVDDVGLAASIHSLVDTMASQYDLRVTVDLGSFREPSYEQRIAIYRIIREALINVAKHAGASSASVSVVETEDTLEAVVADAGHGFGAGSSDGIGMWIMRERAAKHAGTVSVTSGESGTTVRISIPKASNSHAD